MTSLLVLESSMHDFQPSRDACSSVVHFDKVHSSRDLHAQVVTEVTPDRYLLSDSKLTPLSVLVSVACQLTIRTSTYVLVTSASCTPSAGFFIRIVPLEPVRLTFALVYLPMVLCECHVPKSQELYSSYFLWEHHNYFPHLYDAYNIDLRTLSDPFVARSWTTVQHLVVLNSAL